ncbi:uncharacterized protein LOC108101876 [Drosophila ficusphila]|uniref:uncharacterized protein LOC108101876 n=1 Tax=Drosophila ficusphila TaxID=30025 RepID=UPI0007E60EBD|nr:uncharacterized protein LOC108101876 [Drosophila ficusphila]
MAFSNIPVAILCLSILLAGDALGAPVSKPGDQGQLQRIAECRELCYHESLPVATPTLLCRSRPECYMCHDYCHVLVVVQRSLATLMCADQEFCTSGCRVACSYHRIHRKFQQGAGANALLKQ